MFNQENVLQAKLSNGGLFKLERKTWCHENGGNVDLSN